MTREQTYIEQMKSLGIYEPAYESLIKKLAKDERRLSRIEKAWYATVPKGQTPSMLDKHYAAMQELDQKILTQREALGLTPRGLRKLRGVPKGDGRVAGEGISRKLDAILEKVSAYE